jgi:hypothetical protein
MQRRERHATVRARPRPPTWGFLPSPWLKWGTRLSHSWLRRAPRAGARARRRTGCHAACRPSSRGARGCVASGRRRLQREGAARGFTRGERGRGALGDPGYPEGSYPSGPHSNPFGSVSKPSKERPPGAPAAQYSGVGGGGGGEVRCRRPGGSGGGGARHRGALPRQPGRKRPRPPNLQCRGPGGWRARDACAGRAHGTSRRLRALGPPPPARPGSRFAARLRARMGRARGRAPWRAGETSAGAGRLRRGCWHARGHATQCKRRAPDGRAPASGAGPTLLGVFL